MQGVGKDMDPGVVPGNQIPVDPDLVRLDHWHRDTSETGMSIE